MITIRLLTVEDLPLGQRLSAQAGWNQTEADWRRFLTLEPEGCFTASWTEQPVATAAAFVFGRVGWIAMVLVDEAFRHRGIASHLVGHAIRYLVRRGARTIRLDATPLGRPVYERLGFVPEYSLVRLQGTAPPAVRLQTPAPSADQIEAICEFDRRITGTPRRPLIQALIAQQPEAVVTAFTGQGLAGYAMCRPGRRATQIGPALALSATAGAGCLEQILARCPPGTVFADVPADNAEAVAWFAARGFAVQRDFTRMGHGPRIQDFPERMWASSGPEKG